ncbi:MAG: hypothetical protein ACFFD4_02665 [Candidatus Odinarchaeota archaeon]
MVSKSRVLVIFYYEFKGIYNALFSNPIAYFIAIAFGFFLLSWTFQGIFLVSFIVRTFLPDGYDRALVTPLVAHGLTLIFLQRLITGLTRKGVLQQVSEADFDYLFPSPASYRDVYLGLKLKEEFVAFLTLTVLFAPICAGFVLGLETGAVFQETVMAVLAVLLVFWTFLLLTGLIKDLVFFYALDAANVMVQRSLNLLKFSRWLALVLLIVIFTALLGFLSGLALLIDPLIQWLLILELFLPSGLAALAIESIFVGGTMVWSGAAIAAVLIIGTLLLLFLATRSANKHYFEQLLLEKDTAIQGSGRLGVKIQRTFLSMDMARGSLLVMLVKKDLLMIQRVYRRLLFQVYLLPIIFTFIFLLFSSPLVSESASDPLFFRSIMAYSILFIPAVPLVLIGLESKSFYNLKSSGFHGMDFALGKFLVSMLVMGPPVLLLSSVVAVILSDWYLVTTALSAMVIFCAIYTLVGCWKPPWNPRGEIPANMVTSMVSMLLVLVVLGPLLLLSVVNPSGMPVYAMVIMAFALLLAERLYNRLSEFA